MEKELETIPETIPEVKPEVAKPEPKKEFLEVVESTNDPEIRDDLVISAVKFLNDPSIQKSSLNKKVAFLESKKLTNKEIQLALAKATSTKGKSKSKSKRPVASSSSEPSSSGSSNYPPLPASPAPVQSQLPPQPLSTWKDYLSASAVTAAVAYSVYGLTKSFIVPLFKGPTDEEIEKEREKMDQQFEQAFSSIDQFKRDTLTSLDSLHTQRAQIDVSLQTLNESLETLTTQDSTKTVEVEKLWSEMEAIKKMIPESFDKGRESQTSMISDLQKEIEHLKQLLVKHLDLPNKEINSTMKPEQRSNSFTSLLATSIQNGTGAETKKSIPSWQKSLFSNKEKSSDSVTVSAVPDVKANGYHSDPDPVTKSSTNGIVHVNGNAKIKVAENGGKSPISEPDSNSEVKTA